MARAITDYLCHDQAVVESVHSGASGGGGGRSWCGPVDTRRAITARILEQISVAAGCPDARGRTVHPGSVYPCWLVITVIEAAYLFRTVGGLFGPCPGAADVSRPDALSLLPAPPLPTAVKVPAFLLTPIGCQTP